MAGPIVPATPQTVLAHVRKLSDADPDFRFMSLNDLLQLFTHARADFLHHEYNIAARTVESIVRALDDHNSEVQNLAIKCLGPLVDKIPSSLLPPMIDKLSSYKLKNSVDDTVPSLALRSVIAALPRPVAGLPVTPHIKHAYDAIQRVLIPRLVGSTTPTAQLSASNAQPRSVVGLLEDGNNTSPEAVDVLIELIRCFGPLLQSSEVEDILYVIMQLLDNPKLPSVVKKRAVVAISMLAVYLTDDQLDLVVKRLTSSLTQAGTPEITRRLHISILGSMARSIPTRFGPHLPTVTPLLLQALSEAELQQHMDKLGEGDDVTQDFNDVREAALVTLEAFLASCPQGMSQFTEDALASSLRYMKYDPNCALDGDDEAAMDDENEEPDDDDVFDDDDDDFEGDDDDTSWKVRRCAAKAIYTMIATRASGDLLDSGLLYGQAAPILIKRLDEREENVRLEIISALSLLIHKTGEGLHMPDLGLDLLEPEQTTYVPFSRKRRRQSSGGNANTSRMAGLTSPVLAKIPSTGPQADLYRLIPTVVKACIKQLKQKTVPTKQSVIKLLDELVSAQRGGLSNFFPDIIGPVTDEAMATASGTVSSSLAATGSSASATPSTLRVAALRLISDICKTHSSALLQPYLAKMVAAVIAAARDRLYKISSEAIRTAEELIKTMTPPRSRHSGAAYKGELDKLYEVILDRGSASDADAEVRQRAIHALGVLVSRTAAEAGAQLLLPKQRKAALDALLDWLKNETTRLAAVRAIDDVAASAASPSQLEEAWIQEVALELCAQLRKANRYLRSSSVAALKHLVLCGAAKGRLHSSTMESIVSALMPAITTSDTYLLGPALLILADAVQENPDLVMTQDMVLALCQLLKSHFAVIVLDQLLELMSKVGQSGVAQGLMRGLLTDVSVSGDSSVVGKAIGTLLVTGGESTGVSLDSFTSELKTSAKSGDEARVSLALAVLGEAGRRLGASSPLKPQLFLDHFHSEPDKVSLAAAVALGRAGSGNSAQYLPVILGTMKKGGSTQYLLVQSIKEILQSLTVQSVGLGEYALPTWEELLKASENADNRVVCAESVGRLTILDPTTFMPKLETLLKAKSSALRGMAVQAVRYTLPESDDAFDAILKTSLVKMLLVMLQDSDMDIRRLAMSTLNSAAHNKSEIILPHLGELVPFVLHESVIKPELIKEVLLGPFKHTVDDGLEVRKSAYDTLYALMETAYTRMNNVDFYDRVIAGLRDDNDIRQLCNLMVTKLTVLDPDETARRLDAIAEAYRAVLSVKLKDNAVKQDIEKQDEANKSVLRVTLLLGDRVKARVGNAAAATTVASSSTTTATTPINTNTNTNTNTTNYISGGGSSSGNSNAVAGAGAAATGVWGAYWEWVNREFAKQLDKLQEETKKLQV